MSPEAAAATTDGSIRPHRLGRRARMRSAHASPGDTPLVVVQPLASGSEHPGDGERGAAAPITTFRGDASSDAESIWWRPLFEARPGVDEVIGRRFELGELLSEAAIRLKQCFGFDSRIVVERFLDPDADEETDRLFALVVTTLPADQASSRLRRFDDLWWLDNLHRADGLLQVSVEFA